MHEKKTPKQENRRLLWYFQVLNWSPAGASNLIAGREPEAAEPPVCLALVVLSSGIALILSGSAKTKSLRVAMSSFESPLTCN